MQVTQTTLTGKKVIFEAIIEEISGGASLPVARLDNTKVDTSLSIDKRWLLAGAPVYFDPATRTAQLCKSALGITGGGATTPRVGKNHHFKVGDYLNDGVTSSQITAIDATNAGYDILTVGEALLYAAGTKFGEGSVSGTSEALLYSPNGVVKSDTYIADGNADVSVVTIGTVRADALTYPINALYAKSLRGGTAGTGTSLITLQ